MRISSPSPPASNDAPLRRSRLRSRGRPSCSSCELSTGGAAVLRAAELWRLSQLSLASAEKPSDRRRNVPGIGDTTDIQVADKIAALVAIPQLDKEIDLKLIPIAWITPVLDLIGGFHHLDWGPASPLGQELGGNL